MPRNSSGNYTLPAGNPVAANTVIETAWANPTMSDIASGLTDSLDRYGRGTMLSAMKLSDGAQASPALTFNAETSSGLYRAASHDIRFAVAGVDMLKLTDAGATFPLGFVGDITTTGRIKLADGLITAPSLCFANSLTTGLYRSAPGILGIIATRTLINESVDDTVSAFQVRGRTRLREGILPDALPPNANYDSLTIECPGTAGISILTTKTTGAGIAWGDEDNSNIGSIVYTHTNDLMTFTAGAAASLVLADTYVRAVRPLVASDGDAAAPGYAFFAATNTGLFRLPALGIGLSFAGTEMIRFVASGALFSPGNSIIGHNDTTSYLALTSSASGADGTTRMVLYDSAHATNANRITVCSKVLAFTDTTAANEKARFTAATTQGELLINGVNTSGLSLANRGLLTVDGSAGAVLGMLFNGARSGYLNAVSTTEFRLSSGAASCAMTFCLNGVEVARIDTDSTLQYAGNEVGFRGMPVQSKSAVYTMRLVDRGCCIVQTAVGNVVTAAIFVAGDVVSVCNKASGNIGLVATGITLNWGTGTPSTGNRTLAVNALATLYFTANNVATLTGTGIS